MKIKKQICPCCMEEHIPQLIKAKEECLFKGVLVEYTAEYYYCENADETYADEEQISTNDIAMKDAYRKMLGLLSSDQILEIRTRYGISQSDLCIILGWGQKTVTRYESHQVQDKAHDTILRKLDTDPEWFIDLLKSAKNDLSETSYSKYLETCTALFEKNHDTYLRNAIFAMYIRLKQNSEATGGKDLSLDVVSDMVRYYANSPSVTNLYLVKLFKMLWYADALSYKHYNHSISGLIYRALPMGAVPIAYETIIDLSTIQYEEIDIGDGIAYRFPSTKNKKYTNLSKEDKNILDEIILKFGKSTKNEIVDAMHREKAYTETALYDVISFEYTKSLSID